MRALHFDGSLRLADVASPQPGKGEALIRILYSAICNTDLEIIRGYMGFKGIPGHEFVGEVINEKSRFFGKKVVGEINCSCGSCHMCITGRKTHCTNRTVIGIDRHPGVFADYIVLPEENLHIIPDDLAETEAVFTEPLAAAVEIFEQVKTGPGEDIFIFGAGKLGLLIAQVVHLKGCVYRLLDRNPIKIEIARKLGLNAMLAVTLDQTEKAEICIDCTGNPGGIQMALDHLHPRGKLVLKTTVAKTSGIDLNQVVINEFSIIGSRCGPFEPALDLLTKGFVRTDLLISGIFNFTDILGAFDYARQPGVLKVLIRHCEVN
jgi:threonine dehydrogenase-like Zn-dependent dehydrogenase